MSSNEEQLRSFMARLRQLACYAFAKEEATTVRSRVLWKFISGIQSDFIRQEIFRQKWMTDDGKPKSYKDLLSIADKAIAVIRAMKASSQETLGGEVTADKEIDNSSSVGDVFVTNRMSNQLGCVAMHYQAGGNQRQLRGSIESKSKTRRKVECWYCHQFHPGGYKKCWRRTREYLDWETRLQYGWRGRQPPKPAVVYNLGMLQHSTKEEKQNQRTVLGNNEGLLIRIHMSLLYGFRSTEWLLWWTLEQILVGFRKLHWPR